MLRHHRNAFYQEIVGSGLDPSVFEIEERGGLDNHVELLIAYVPAEGDLYFVTRNPNDDFDKFDCGYARFTPAYVFEEFLPKTGYVTIEDVRATFRDWLRNDVTAAMEDLRIPNLWESAVAGTALAMSDEGEKDAGFSEPEVIQVKAGIHLFESTVREHFAPTEAQLADVHGQLRYLTDAAERLSKFDWKGVALSTLISITIALNLDTEQGRRLFGLFQQALQAIFRMLP